MPSTVCPQLFALRYGDVYSGQYADDRKHGTGRMAYAKGEVLGYDGTWEHGRKDGGAPKKPRCVLTYRNGDV